LFDLLKLEVISASQRKARGFRIGFALLSEILTDFPSGKEGRT